MRLAASTLGLPGASLDEIVEVLVAGGCTGVELRAAPGEVVHVGLSSAERVRVRDRLSEAGLTVLSVCSYVKLCAPGDADIEGHVRLAADVGAAAVRLFPGGSDEQLGIRRLTEAEPMARQLGVRLLVETHDSHPRGADVARLLGATPGAGAIWDFVHPWRAGEPPSGTYAALADRLGYVQLKDMAGPTPALVGSGDLPLSEIRAVLRDYDGWWSVEWEKAWYPDIPPLADALAAARAWLDTRT
jgi:sugar phosphate isomerase/epimerase